MEYWRSVEDFEKDPKLKELFENEFQSSPQARDGENNDFARRDFLRLMGASFALATTACIRRPVQHIIPYAKAPKEITPGLPNYYASTWFDGVEGYGTVVKTLDGRPVKVEGNTLHPFNRGGLSARAHGAILNNYDPDRLRAPIRNLPNPERTNKETISTTWAEVDAKVVEKLKAGGVAVLTSTLPSPSTKALLADFMRATGGTHVAYDTFSMDSLRTAQEAAYGRGVVPNYRFDQADLIVSIGCDFLGTFGSPASNTKAFSSRRKPGAKMNRLVMFEPLMSLTGMNADDRYAVSASQQLDVALALLSRVASEVGAGGVREMLSQHRKNSRLDIDSGILDGIAKELLANRRKGLVIAGGFAGETADAEQLHLAVNMLNSLLGNDGVTVDYEVARPLTAQGSGKTLETLIARMKAGEIKTLVIHGLNPLYSLPEASGFREGLRKVPFVVYTGNFNDETAAGSHFVVPAGTSFENWGDFELQSGVWSLQQPTIEPMYSTRSFEDSMLAWLKAMNATKVENFQSYVKDVWRREVYPSAGRGRSFDEFWIAALQDGVMDLVGKDRRERALASRGASGSTLKIPKAKNDGLELVLYAKIGIGDGQYANVAWLQELPDPVSKIVWDNYATVSPELAKKMNWRQGDVLKLEANGGSVEAPVFIQPGQHDGVIGLAIGYGRTLAGKVGSNIGVNAYKLAGWQKGRVVGSGLAVEVVNTKRRYELATTQNHNMLHDPKIEKEDRFIVAETTNEAFQKNPASGINKYHVFSIWPEHAYTGHKWGMAIDLNSCTGCSACVTACQSENNIPVVGKRYVMEGREMHWIRIDRYYKGSMSSPDTVFQPMICQHCENAPCETVCPVLATVHSEDGLNDMVYNRCVGTRYCANNCPYKVRRFNWFNYTKHYPEPTHMALNPDVTVRTRGVMEKCSFCVQRIRAGTNLARDEKRALRDGDIKTACEDSCPADAITFGDLNDPNSRVAGLHKEKRTYYVLDELNTKPRVRYMTKVRNASRVVKEHKAAAEEEGGHA